jgi:hypothetical protein
LLIVAPVRRVFERIKSEVGLSAPHRLADRISVLYLPPSSEAIDLSAVAEPRTGRSSLPQAEQFSEHPASWRVELFGDAVPI